MPTFDPRTVKLGKAPARHDNRTLQAAKYFQALPPAPVRCDWSGKASPFGQMLNNELGDCTAAAAGHLVQIWTAANGNQVILPDADILTFYELCSGYNPADPSTDQGAVELDVLNKWRQVGLADRKISAYAALQLANREHLRLAVSLTGGAYLGGQLPVSAQSQEVWAVPAGGTTGNGAPGTWGGHAVPAVAYDETGVTVITWGALLTMTWEFFDTYVDEAYCVLSGEWAQGGAAAPSGMDLAELSSDLAQVTG